MAQNVNMRGLTPFMTSDGVRSYQWDISSRLVKITWAGGYTTKFHYNALGQRSERIEQNNYGSITAHYYYLYDGNNLVCRYNGGTSTSNIDRRYFAQGEQRYNQTYDDWPRYFYCRDHLGSIREVMFDDGELAARYDL